MNVIAAEQTADQTRTAFENVLREDTDMVAEVKFLGPTDYRGSRWKATIPAYNRAGFHGKGEITHTLPVDYGLSNLENAYNAVTALIEKIAQQTSPPSGVWLQLQIISELNIGQDKIGFRIRQTWHNH